MGLRICFVVIVFHLGFSNWVLADRGVPSKTDICGRFPNSAFCQADSPTPSSSASDKAAYCSQYNPNFKYFCGGPGSGDPRLSSNNFCSGYAAVCNIQSSRPQQNPAGPSANPGGAGVGPAVPQAPTPNSPEMCYQYQYLAQSSCTNPVTENANTRYYCNYYRQYCQTTQTAPGVINTGVPTAADPRCGPYQKQFEFACIRQPITVASSEFCQSYITYCSNYQAPQVVQAPVAQPAVPQTPTGASPDQIQQLCNQYQSQALQYCKGGEIGQVKQLCDQYRQYCIKSSSRRRRALWTR